MVQGLCRASKGREGMAFSHEYIRQGAFQLPPCSSRPSMLEALGCWPSCKTLLQQLMSSFKVHSCQEQLLGQPSNQH